MPFVDRAAALRFLDEAELREWRESAVGTNPRKRVVVLSADGLEVRAVFRYMYSHKPEARGFLDSYRSELAAQALAGLLGLEHVPPTAERKLRGKRGSLQLWIHGARPYADVRRELGDAPDPQALARALDTMRLFDALIANQDRNPGNVLLGGDGRIWWIDHSRSFGGGERLRGLDAVTGCDRAFRDALAALGDGEIEAALRPFTPYVEDLLARRDAVLEWIAGRARDDPSFLRESEPPYNPAIRRREGTAWTARRPSR